MAQSLTLQRQAVRGRSNQPTASHGPCPGGRGQSTPRDSGGRDPRTETGPPDFVNARDQQGLAAEDTGRAGSTLFGAVGAERVLAARDSRPALVIIPQLLYIVKNL